MSEESLVFYNVLDDYIEYLRAIDTKVSFNKPDEHTRPYVGFVISLNDNVKYLVPLSSKIRKTNAVTTIIPNRFTKDQLDSGEYKEFPQKIATIKFNCMIPIFKDVIKRINLEEIAINIEGTNYKNLLLKEIEYCKENKDRIVKKAEKTYGIYKDNKPYMKSIVDSCCDFKLLEKKCKEYEALRLPQEESAADIRKEVNKQDKL